MMSIKLRVQKRILCFIVIFILGMSTVVNGVTTKKVYSTDKYNNTIELKKNISFDGVYDSYSWNLNIPENINVSKAKLSLEYEVTDIIREGVGSYLTFLVNKIEFYSFKIPESAKDTEVVQIELPIELFKTGFNEVKIDGYLRVSDKACLDDYNSANWLVIKENSNIILEQANMISENILSKFPYPFVNSGGYDETLVIVPEEYSDKELSAALKFSTLIGREEGKAKLIKSGDLQKIEKINNRNIVSISKTSNMPFEIKEKIGEINNVDNNGFIKYMNSPLSDKEDIKCLVIVSNDDTQLDNAVRFLMNEQLVSQIHMSETYVDSNINLDSIIKEEKSNYTFAELGYNEYAVEGLFRHDVILGYSLPKNRRVAVGDIINIKMRYAENLDFDRSLCTVYLNDIPIGSKKLSKESANEDEIVVTVPEDAANKSYFEIKIAFDLLLDGVDCEVNNYNQPWAMIREDSFIKLDTSILNQYYFSSYPAPFVENWDMNDVLFVLPDVLTEGELDGIGKLLAFMGRDTKYNLGQLECIRSSNLKSEHKDRNIIVYGTPTNNKLIKNLNNDLWVKYNDDYSTFVSNEKIILTKYFAENITTFQLDKSPFDIKKNMLVLTSTKTELLEKSLKFLSSNEEVYKLSGDGSIIDEYGNVRNFKYKEEEKIPIYERVEKMKSKSIGLLVIIILIVVFLFVGCILYLYKNKIKK